MAKKIRFPLELADGTQAHTLEELREHFDLASVLEYYSNGKLLVWLQDRYIESEAEAIAALDSNAAGFQRSLCEIFGVDYQSEEDLEAIQRRQERLTRLRTITDEEEFLQKVDQVAFDQEELADLLDEGVTTIYLCGKQFLIPISQKNITYIGINNPAVHLSGTLPEDMKGTGILCKDCFVDNWPDVAETVAEETPDVEGEVAKAAKLKTEEKKKHDARLMELYGVDEAGLTKIYQHARDVAATTWTSDEAMGCTLDEYVESIVVYPLHVNVASGLIPQPVTGWLSHINFGPGGIFEKPGTRRRTVDTMIEQPETQDSTSRKFFSYEK